jgi:hypothetical protein
MLLKREKNIEEKASLERRNELSAKIRAGIAKAKTAVVDTECAIFALAVVGGDSNRTDAYE